MSEVALKGVWIACRKTTMEVDGSMHYLERSSSTSERRGIV